MGVDTATQATDATRQADEIIARIDRIPFTRFHLHIASVLGVGTFFDAFDSLVFGTALTAIFREMHISLVNIGLLISAAFIGQFIGALAIGGLAERFGRKNAFALAMLLFGLMSFANMLAWNVQSLFIFRLIQGLGLGAEVPIAGALFNEWVRGRTRGKVVIMYENLFIYGIILGPLAGLAFFGAFGQSTGWRALFALGGLPVFVAIYALFRLPESARWLADKGHIAAAEKLVSKLESDISRRGGVLPPPNVKYRLSVQKTRLGELFSPEYRSRTALCWTHWFTSYFTGGILTGWLPILYIRNGGLPQSRALLLILAGSVMTLAVGYFLAFTIDHIGRKPLFLAGYSLAAFGCLLGLFLIYGLHITGWPPLLAFGLFMSFSSGLNSDGVYVYTPELYPTRMRAWATATASSMNRLAQFIAPTVVGILLALSFGIGAILLLMLADLLIGLVVMAWLGIETKQKTLEEIAA